MGYPKLMVQLNHPCYEVDVWAVESAEEEDIALKQGYLDLEGVRLIVTVYKEGLRRRHKEATKELKK